MGTSRKEIDKETMYKKIMPSSYKLQRSAENPEPDKISEVAMPPIQTPVFSQPLSGIPLPRKPAPPLDMGVQIKPANSTVLVNIMERLVIDKLDAAFSKFNCCKCDRCRKDVAAIALNKLKPKYVVTSQEAMDAMTSRQTNAEVYTALVQAILIVKAKPRH